MKKTILIVDDDESVCATVSKLLSRDYRTVTACNCREALDIIKRDENIDLLMTDMVMPDMSGRELLYRIRNLKNKVPAIVFSGYFTSGANGNSGDHDVYAYLSKPFELDLLYQTVSSALKGSKDV